jgi:hypothetical protein
LLSSWRELTTQLHLLQRLRISGFPVNFRGLHVAFYLYQHSGVEQIRDVTTLNCHSKILLRDMIVCRRDVSGWAVLAMCKLACVNNSRLCVECAALSRCWEGQLNQCYCPNAFTIVGKCDGGKSWPTTAVGKDVAIGKGKGKGKVHPRIGDEGPEGE